MRASSLVLAALAAMGASACATAPAPPPSGTSGPPPPVANYDWSFGAEGGRGGLVFGLQESDDVWIVMNCRQSSGRLDLSVASPTASREVVLMAGAETGRFPARAESSEIDEGYFLEAQAPSSAPVFQAFRREGWMRLGVSGAHAAPMVPHPASQSSIERFFAYCG